jgi:riboflavin synthase alpha subunit
MQLELLEQTKTPEHLQLIEMKKRFKVEIDILKKDQERQLKDHKEMLDVQ